MVPELQVLLERLEIDGLDLQVVHSKETGGGERQHQRATHDAAGVLAGHICEVEDEEGGVAEAARGAELVVRQAVDAEHDAAHAVTPQRHAADQPLVSEGEH